MPSVQYTQKRAQIFYTRLQRQSDIILHFLYFSAPCRRFFLPSPPATAMTTARNFYDPFTDLARFHDDLPKPDESFAAHCPTPPPAAFSKRRDIARFCYLRRAQPAGHIKTCKNPKIQTFCIPLRHFFRKCIHGKKRCLTLQKSPVSHTVIWDIQKNVKNHLSVAQNEIEEVPPHTRRKTTKKWRKVSKKT